MNLHAPSPDLRMPLGEKLRRVNQHALGLAVGLLALVITLDTVANMISFGALFAFSAVNLAVVKHYLVEKFGIAGNDLVTVGYGETRLKKPEAPRDAANRRVQVVNMQNQTASR